MQSQFVTPELLYTLVSQALSEDLNGLSAENGDITAQLIPKEQTAQAHVITREECIFCGKELILEVFKQVDPKVSVDIHVQDGDLLPANTTLFTAKGSARAILTAERTALNFVQTLSATATTTHKYVNKLKGTKTKLLDTRKTIPSLRALQKYAVHCGGGRNHRMGLFDAFLIKENHIIACNGIKNAVQQARENHPDKPVEVEVENIEELTQALNAKADIIMLDNFSIEQIKQAVELSNGKAKLEVSGNMTFDTLSEYAQSGIDYISSGALTKNIQSIDLSMRFK